MKHLITLLLLIVSVATTSAQVGINTTTPDLSSILDIESTEKGVLFPRMTTAERNIIANPANGLIIYNTDTDEFQFNSNSTTTPIWEAFSLTPTSTASAGQ